MTVVSAKLFEVIAEQARQRPPLMMDIAVSRCGRDRAMVVELERVIPVEAERAVDLMRSPCYRGYRFAGFRLGHRHFSEGGLT